MVKNNILVNEMTGRRYIEVLSVEIHQFFFRKKNVRGLLS